MLSVEILDALRAHDQHLWACGDALVKETDGSRKQLRAVATELEAHGLDSVVRPLSGGSFSLSVLYRTAKLFPPDKRQPIAWEWHAMARSERELLFIITCLQDDQHPHDAATVRKLLAIARRRGRLS
jgi:hypothetical protein